MVAVGLDHLNGTAIETTDTRDLDHHSETKTFEGTEMTTAQVAHPHLAGIAQLVR
jgi:hypothetical protein